jgi:EAL domain-containing protein (putative c-di-GMP-specific phosphodiesterase class I)
MWISVKIDKQFVHGPRTAIAGMDLFASMVDLSHRLGAQNVVEIGNETAQHLNLRRGLQGIFRATKPITDY